MPTPATVVDNIFRHVGALIYLVVLLSLVVFLICETVKEVKYCLQRKKEKKNACLRER